MFRIYVAGFPIPIGLLGKCLSHAGLVEHLSFIKGLRRPGQKGSAYCKAAENSHSFPPGDPYHLPPQPAPPTTPTHPPIPSSAAACLRCRPLSSAQRLLSDRQLSGWSLRFPGCPGAGREVKRSRGQPADLQRWGEQQANLLTAIPTNSPNMHHYSRAQ